VGHHDRDPTIGGVRSNSSASRRGGVTLEQGVFGLGIQRRRRLVKHKQERVIPHEPTRPAPVSATGRSCAAARGADIAARCPYRAKPVQATVTAIAVERNILLPPL